MFLHYIVSSVCGTSSDGKAPHTLPILFHSGRNNIDSSFVALYNWFCSFTVHETMPLWTLSLTLPFWSSGRLLICYLLFRMHWSWTPLITSHILGEIWKQIQQFDLFLNRKLYHWSAAVRVDLPLLPRLKLILEGDIYSWQSLHIIKVRLC